MSNTTNYYEELIDNEMINLVAGDDVALREKLLSVPLKEKRLIILAILDEDRKMYMSIRNIIKNNIVSKTEHIQEVVAMLRNYVKVSKVEKKKFGEVMTPISLVEEMLDTLPKEVWSNPNLKWLDPANGVGVFPSVIVSRLMEGLKSWEHDDEKRYKHIVENMIYVCELQPKNMFLHLCAFDPNDEYLLNIYTGSFLSEEFDEYCKNVWKVEKFDIIVMNPPYQTLKEGNRKSQPLWDKFVIKTISQLIDSGYLVAVHPDSWRRVDGDFKSIGNLIRSKQITYLEVHNTDDGVKTFGVHTTYDFYCLHNTPTTMVTKIKCMDGTTQRIDISKMEFIPNGMFKEFEKLLAKGDKEKVQILYSRSNYGNDKKKQMSKTQTHEHIYPCIYLTYKDGSYQLWYSNTNKKGHFGIPKVIWSNGGASNPIVDINGEFGVMNFACSIVDEPKNLPFIQKAMLHPDFLKLMSFADGVTGVGRHRYNKKAISLFRKDFWKEFIND